MRTPETTTIRTRARILIVDDIPAATHAMGKLLRKYGYEAIEETNPTKVLTLAHRFKPDLILLDVCMPWKDGYAVADELAEDEAFCDVPVIMMTGYPQQVDPLHPQSILIKPFSIEELLENVENSLHEQHAVPA